MLVPTTISFPSPSVYIPGLYASGGLTLPALAAIVFVHGLCLPLPLYLPFAVFAMAFGGPRHCASIICIFELVGLCSSSASRHGQSGRLGGAISGPHGLLRLHRKA